GATQPSFVSPLNPALVQARQQAGIADCPVSDDSVAALADGLPDLVLDCIGGDSRVRLAGLRGKPMLINFWAQWCAPCRAESPHLREFSQRAGDKVLILGVDFADPRPDLAIEFAQLVSWPYAHVVDPERQTEAALRITGIPVSFLVDADGKIVHRQVGPFLSTDELIALAQEKLGVTL
ncbi:MAG: TlpA disulfide reductase family protein, partial [Micropruina sp.]